MQTLLNINAGKYRSHESTKCTEDLFCSLLLQEKLCFFKNDFLNFKLYVDCITDCITGLHRERSDVN